jgi:hypothetical protein
LSSIWEIATSPVFNYCGANLKKGAMFFAAPENHILSAVVACDVYLAARLFMLFAKP